MSNNFFIIGNGDSGTSLLRGLLNAHSRIYCEFESWRHKSVNVKIGHPEKTKIPNKQSLQMLFWVKEAEYHNEQNPKMIWGNKVPLEQFITYKWKDHQILKIGKKFHVIYIFRRYSQYSKSSFRSSTYQENWARSGRLYWKFREQDPARVLHISFEDLLLWTEFELKKICRFLGVGYQKKMIEKGTVETGHPNYAYGCIMTEKI
jgi:hypothetical protein